MKDFLAPVSAMRSLEAYREYQKKVWLPAVSDTSRFEAYVRDMVVIQSDGTVRPRITDAGGVNDYFFSRIDGVKVIPINIPSGSMNRLTI